MEIKSLISTRRSPILAAFLALLLPYLALTEIGPTVLTDQSVNTLADGQVEDASGKSDANGAGVPEPKPVTYWLSATGQSVTGSNYKLAVSRSGISEPEINEYESPTAPKYLTLSRVECKRLEFALPGLKPSGVS